MNKKNKILPNRFRWLITIDLDGTLLKTGSTHTEFFINEKNIEAIKKMIDLGHKIAIVTGRPWNDTEKVYKKLGLNTIVGNYNGALIVHPNDEGFIPFCSTINRNIVKDLLNEEVIKKTLLNIIIEDERGPSILNFDDQMMDQFHIKDNPKVEKINSNFEILINPYSVILHIDNSKIDPEEVLQTLKRIYGNGLTLRFWVSKTNIERYYLELNSFGANKATALRKIAAYYNIPMHRTLSFGDGLNDIEMLSEAAYGVAMKNANNIVKSYAKDVTDLNNDDGGVGDFLYKFFKYDLVSSD